MRLAEHVAHTTDVDGMLAKISHEQFNEWCAKDLIEPIGQRPVYEVLARIGVMLAAMTGQEVNETYFLPWEKIVPAKESKPTPAGSAAMLTNHMQTLMAGK